MATTVRTTTTVRVKPRLRGVIHEVAFYVAAVLAIPLLLTAPPGRARVAAAVFAACVPLCFGASALYHRPTWSPRARSWLARLDHAGVYLLIAGTYTPFGLLVLSPGWAVPVLAIVWGGAAAAILMKLFWSGTPKWASAVIGLSLGWTGVAAIGELAKVGAAGLTLVAVGGFMYTVGAVVYARKRPDPAPALFGYHEIFHACTVAGAGCQYAAVALFVLPLG
jgi:hemolysin III